MDKTMERAPAGTDFLKLLAAAVADELEARLLNLNGEELLRIFFKKVHVDFNIYQKGDAP